MFIVGFLLCNKLLFSDKERLRSTLIDDKGPESYDSISVMSRSWWLTHSILVGNKVRSRNAPRNSATVPSHYRQRLVLLYLASILLSNSYSPEPNPGPECLSDSQSRSSWLCGTCDRPVDWSDRGLACNTCGLWYHAHCQDLNTLHYQHHEDLGEEEPWYCALCGNPNSYTALDLYGVDISISNSLPSLPEVDCSTPTEKTMKRPLHCSTPSMAAQQNKWKKRPLRIVNVNFHSAVGKKPEILNLLDSVRPDIVIGTETWMDGEIADSEIFPSSYLPLYRKDRNRHGGGVLVAIHNSLESSEVKELLVENCELVWCKVKLKGERDLYVCAHYRPDDGDEPSLLNLNISMDRAAQIPNAHLLIGGDFNFPSWDWKNMCLKPNPVYARLHINFIHMLNDHGLEQVVNDSTREKNTLDIILTNHPNLVPRVEILPGLSDHCAVYCEYSINAQKRKQSPRIIPLYSKADWTGLKEAMLQLSQKISDLAPHSSTADLWTCFRDTLKSCIQKYVPHKQVQAKENKPWISPSLRKLIKRKNRIFKKMRIRGTEELKTLHKQLRSEVQRQLRRSYWAYIDNSLTEPEPGASNRVENKRFWTYMKHTRSSNIGVAPLLDNGKLSSEPKDQAEILNKQFQSVFGAGVTYSKEEFSTKCRLPYRDFPSLDHIDITTKGVVKLLKELKPGKAPGPDNISPLILKELAEEIGPALATIYRSSITTGTLPSDWKTANVTPVFKKGDKHLASNYRPVSLTSVCCKVLEHIVTSNIMNHIEVHQVLCPQQHGFRSRRSCETQLLDLTNELFDNLEGGKQTDILILDFAKAFDKVNHSLLIHKLNYYGIRGVINAWVEDFLRDRMQAVVVNSARSNLIPVLSGVPQGSVLGPCLFLLYINDLPDTLETNSRLFADDTAVYCKISTANDHNALQQDLDSLATWEQKWDMQFHPDKCTTLPVTRGKRPQHFDYSLHNHTLETVKNAKYLGVTISNDLKWERHINQVCAKANKTLGFLRRNLKVSSRKIKETAYKAFVRPILEYACSVWDPHTEQEIDKLEAVQRRAARFVLRRYRQTDSPSSMLEELQWPSLQERRRIARLSMLYKIKNDKACAETIKSNLHPPPPRRRRGHNQQLVVPRCRTLYRQQSFLPRTIKDWNDLPQDAVEATTVDTFVSRASRRRL